MNLVETIMKQIAVSVPLLAGLMTRDSVSAPDRASYCLKAARVMYGCYRKSDAYDPEVFAAAAAAVLSEYELRIVDFVTDPRTGLPSKLKWPPEIKEVRDACQAIVEDELERVRRDEGLQRQFAEREAYERQLAARANNPTREELIARGDLKPEPVRPLPPCELWSVWCRARQISTNTLSTDTRAILEAAGYAVDGPDDQRPQEKAA